MGKDFEVNQRVHVRLMWDDGHVYWRMGIVTLVVKRPSAETEYVVRFESPLDGPLGESPKEIVPGVLLYGDRCALFTADRMRRTTLAEEFSQASLPWQISTEW